MVMVRDPERSILQYVSTGSAEHRHLQATMGRRSTVLRVNVDLLAPSVT